MSRLSLGADRSKEERDMCPAGSEQKILAKNKTSEMLSMEYEIIHEFCDLVCTWKLFES